MELRTFVRGMEDILHLDEPDLLSRAGLLLQALIQTREWLPAEYAVPRPERYQQYLLYCDPQERFSIVSFVWCSGQRTPIHDHCVWGLIGQLEGCEQETLYHLSPWRAGRVSVFGPGDVSRVSPQLPNNDIHVVANVSEATAISIHVYGCNIGAKSRHVYDPLTGETKMFVSGYSSAIPLLFTSGRMTRGEKRQREEKDDIEDNNISVKSTGATDVKRALRAAFLRQGSEIAFLDVREAAVVQDTGHPLFSILLSLSNIEKHISRLVPRLNTPVVLLDEGGDDQRAVYCAKLLISRGYADVSVLEGGMLQWQNQGFEVFTGCGVPSKAFGEHVCEDLECPMVEPTELASLLSQQKSEVFIVDARPFTEFHHMSIPGGRWAGGAELVLKTFELLNQTSSATTTTDSTASSATTTTDSTASSATTTADSASSSIAPIVVVNCAGRTRSIIGAQSLINAELPTKVFALAGGTMGWKLSGLTVARDSQICAPFPTRPALLAAQNSAKKVAQKFNLKSCTMQDVSVWRADSSRSLFVFDVRLLVEYELGHLEGWTNAPGGQLVQALDEFVGTLGSRVVLSDGGEQVRAWLTASWLEQMGMVEVFVLGNDDSVLPMDTRSTPVFPWLSAPGWNDWVHPAVLAMWLSSSSPPLVLDCGLSTSYNKGHIPGSAWISRHHFFSSSSPPLPPNPVYVLTDDEGGKRAERIVADLLSFLRTYANDKQCQVFVLRGGNGAWAENLESERATFLSPILDVTFRPYESIDAPEHAMRAYLEWEYGLCEQVRRDGDAPWRNVKAKTFS